MTRPDPSPPYPPSCEECGEEGYRATPLRWRALPTGDKLLIHAACWANLRGEISDRFGIGNANAERYR